jgi:hypothetical protein
MGGIFNPLIKLPIELGYFPALLLHQQDIRYGDFAAPFYGSP